MTSEPNGGRPDDAPLPPPPPPSAPDSTPEQAWDRMHAADVTPTELAQIASQHPHLRPYVAAHPDTHPQLLTWLAALGDPVVNAALASRSGRNQSTKNQSSADTESPTRRAPSPPPPNNATPAARAPQTDTPTPLPPRRRLGTRAIAAIAVTTILIACGLAAAAIVRTHHGNPAANPDEQPRLTDLRTQPHTAWTWRPDTTPADDHGIDSATEVGNDALAVAWSGSQDPHGHLAVLSTDDGSQRWQNDVQSCPGNADGIWVFAGDGVAGYYQHQCPDDTSTVVGLYDVSTGATLSASTVPGDVQTIVVLDHTAVAAWQDATGAGYLTAWPVNNIGGNALWERTYPSSAWPQICIAGPQLVGLLANQVVQASDGDATNFACAGAALADLADVTDGGTNPLGTRDDTIYESVIGGDMLRVDWSSGDWDLFDQAGKALRSGTGGTPDALYTMGVIGGVLVRWDPPTSTVIGVDPETGHDLWTKGIDNHGTQLGASSQALVYADDTGTTTWYDSATGNPLMNASLPEASACRAAPGETLAYLIGSCFGDDTALAAYDPVTGKRLWTLTPEPDSTVEPLGRHFYQLPQGDGPPSIALLMSSSRM